MAKTSIVLNGIKACDTVKKARDWLDARKLDYTFNDYRAEGLARRDLDAWIKAVGWEKLLNRASTTFRELPDAEKQDLDKAKAIKLMLSHPTLIKRPVLVAGDTVLVGFKPEMYAEAFSP